MSADVPPGLGQDARQPADELTMASLIASGDHQGALAVMSGATSPNHRMINMAFSASVASGGHVDLDMT